jgi:phosphate transport system substrate-binding protein
VNRTPLARATLLGTLSLSVALGLSACSASNETGSASTTSGSNTTSSGSGGSGAQMSGTLNGAGSSAQEAAMAAWKQGFQSSNPGATVNYDAVGSGSGREQFIAGGVQFAGSDSYLTPEEVAAAKKTCGSEPIEVPVYVSPIAVIYNLQGVDKLQLTPQTLAQIFAGRITSWDDPAIKADNRGASLPSTSITPVHRSDDSGTTANFTDYLSQVAKRDWTYPADDTWPTKGGESADGTSGVVSAVTQGDGTIGYADASQAADLDQALIKVGTRYVSPTQQAASAVLSESTPVPGRAGTDMAMDVKRTTAKAGVYPIVLVSYQITCSTYDSKATADLVKGFESYVISSAGQDAASQQAGSAPITDTLRQKAQQAIDTISATN